MLARRDTSNYIIFHFLVIYEFNLHMSLIFKMFSQQDNVVLDELATWVFTKGVEILFLNFSYVYVEAKNLENFIYCPLSVSPSLSLLWRYTVYLYIINCMINIWFFYLERKLNINCIVYYAVSCTCTYKALYLPL